MRFDVLTLFPEMVENYFNFSILKRAVEAGVVSVNTINPRDFAANKHKKVDEGRQRGFPKCRGLCSPG